MNKHIGYDFPKWVTGLDLYRIALSRRGSMKFTVDNFAKGPDAIFTVREFYAVRDILDENGLFSPVDKDDLLKGFEWTQAGLFFLMDIISFYESPPSPSDR